MDTFSKIKTMVVDDDSNDMELICQYIDIEPHLELVLTETSAARAFQYLQQHPIDLLVLDVNIPQMSGMDLATALPEPKPPIIITSGYPDTAIDAYEVGVADFVKKPVTLARFLKAVQRAVGHRIGQPIAEPPADFIFVREVGSPTYTRFYLDDILCIESKRNDLLIHRLGYVARTRMTLSEMEAQLPADQFMKVHDSFMVSLKKVHQFTMKTAKIEIKGIDFGIPVSRTYLNRFQSWFFRGNI